MNAYKINDAEIYAATSEVEAKAAFQKDTGVYVEEVEQMSPQDKWEDEENPEHKTVGNVLASLTGTEARLIGVDGFYI